MAKIEFYKMSGSGNDFILIDNCSKNIALPDAAEFARKVCRRGLSVGADGLIIIEPSTEADFAWRFYNADGSMPEMCGNGGRCAGRFAFLKKIAGPKMTFKTLAGIIQAEVKGTSVKVKMVPPRGLEFQIPLALESHRLLVDSINTGVPHVVAFVNDLDNFDVAGIGRQIRFHPRFQSAGTNANFVQVVDKSFLRIRTYERGVEGETLACGTGATAAALVAAHKGIVTSPVSVHTKGGETLIIYFEGTGPDFGNVYLEGHVRVVYQGTLWEEALD